MAETHMDIVQEGLESFPGPVGWAEAPGDCGHPEESVSLTALVLLPATPEEAPGPKRVGSPTHGPSREMSPLDVRPYNSTLPAPSKIPIRATTSPFLTDRAPECLESVFMAEVQVHPFKPPPPLLLSLPSGSGVQH